MYIEEGKSAEKRAVFTTGLEDSQGYRFCGLVFGKRYFIIATGRECYQLQIDLPVIIMEMLVEELRAKRSIRKRSRTKERHLINIFMVH